MVLQLCLNNLTYVILQSISPCVRIIMTIVLSAMYVSFFNEKMTLKYYNFSVFFFPKFGLKDVNTIKRVERLTRVRSSFTSIYKESEKCTRKKDRHK